MWKPACPLSSRSWGRGIRRVWAIWEHQQCTQSSGSSSSSARSPRTQAEKEKRRREKQTAILNNQNTVEDEGMKWNEKGTIVYHGSTLSGEKKDTSLPFPAFYSPQYVESCWYQWWEKEGFFSPEVHSGLPQAVNRCFSMCIPPPNVTGNLHLGHALTVAIEDALVRWRRMQGYKVVWVPGCDHAGIATQSVVERWLLRQRGKRRKDYSREEFLQEVWHWKNEKGGEIYRQLRKLGASLDWSRSCFTMDTAFSDAVTEAFVRLCDSGLVYRSEGLVNWSCALDSAISDIEVDLVHLPGRTLLSVPGYEQKVEFGTLFTFAYPLEGRDGEVLVSTTRPETMLGDVAIAVNPDDARYQALHGKYCRHPFTDRLLPLITDPLVDMSLGTGAVKVTPAHDHTDFLLSQRHSLPRLTVIGGDGTMTSSCGQWLEGVRRFEARVQVVDALKERQLFRGRQDHAMSLPVCSRSGDVIEPLLKRQWFVRCEQMARRAIQAVEDGELRIVPSMYNKTWKTWLSNISDWCISRQLWWGHQIPAYRVSLSGSIDTDEEQWVWGRSEEEARERAAARLGVTPDAVTLTRGEWSQLTIARAAEGAVPRSRRLIGRMPLAFSADPDVLDTWFSSALFPFAMLGWPQQTQDLQQFYPNSLLETGSDLIFFWVARMAMLGMELTGQLPFKQVLFHSLVRDNHGRKMSKSLGNVIDPLDIISGVSLQRLQDKIKDGNLDPREASIAMKAQKKDYPKGIPECGTDALRFALCTYKAQGEDISLSVSQVLNCRRFCNKMWQTVRFTLGVLEQAGRDPQTLAEVSPFSSEDRWLCSRLYSTVLQCERGFESYNLQAVTTAVQSFWVHSLCDAYLECIKPVLTEASTEGFQQRAAARGILLHSVSVSLALLSPFMPFLTEELWQRLRPHLAGTVATSLCLQPYPQSSQMSHWHFPQEEADFAFVQEVVRVARGLRTQCHMTKERPDMWVVCSASQAEILLRFSSTIRTLSRVSSLNLHCPQGGGEAPPKGCAVDVVDPSCEVHLHTQGTVDTDAQKDLLSNRKEKILSKLQRCLSQAEMPHYEEKVPESVRQEMQNRISALEQELKNTEDQLLNLHQLKGQES